MKRHIAESPEQKKIISLLDELIKAVSSYTENPRLEFVTNRREPHSMVKTAVRQMLFHTKAFPGAGDLDLSRIGVVSLEPKNYNLNFYTVWAIEQIYNQANEI